jgi:hypothetical protein
MAGCRSYPLTDTQQFDILPLAHGERPDVSRGQVIGSSIPRANAVPRMRRWFLSYNSQDLGLMQSLEEALRRRDPDAGIFFAPKSLRAGGLWLPQLASEITEATAFYQPMTDHGILRGARPPRGARLRNARLPSRSKGTHNRKCHPQRHRRGC